MSKPQNVFLKTKKNKKQLSSFVINYHPSAKILSISTSGQRQSTAVCQNGLKLEK